MKKQYGCALLWGQRKIDWWCFPCHTLSFFVLCTAILSPLDDILSQWLRLLHLEEYCRYSWAKHGGLEFKVSQAEFLFFSVQWNRGLKLIKISARRWGSPCWANRGSPFCHILSFWLTWMWKRFDIIQLRKERGVSERQLDLFLHGLYCNRQLNIYRAFKLILKCAWRKSPSGVVQDSSPTHLHRSWKQWARTFLDWLPSGHSRLRGPVILNCPNLLFSTQCHNFPFPESFGKSCTCAWNWPAALNLITGQIHLVHSSLIWAGLYHKPSTTTNLKTTSLVLLLVKSRQWKYMIPI